MNFWDVFFVCVTIDIGLLTIFVLVYTAFSKKVYQKYDHQIKDELHRLNRIKADNGDFDILKSKVNKITCKHKNIEFLTNPSRSHTFLIAENLLINHM